MFNKYLLFGSVYRYQADFNKLRNSTKVQHHFLELSSVTDPAMQAMIRKRLEYSYDITDEESCLEYLEDLQSQRLISQPFYSVLVDLWQTNKELTFLEEINFDDLGLTDDYLLSQIHRYERDMDAEDETFFLEALKDQLVTLVAEPQSLVKIYNTLDQYADLVNMANPFIYWAYDIARYTEITRESFEVGYISLETANEILNALGTNVENRYVSWEQFLASSVIGKCFKSDGSQFSNNDILNIKSYVTNIYQAINSPNELFTKSGIWGQSNLNQLSFKMEKLFDLKPKKIADALAEYGVNYHLKTQSVTHLYNYILKPLTESGLFSFIRSTKELFPLLFAMADTDQDVYFWKKFDNLKSDFELFFSKNEIPLLNLNNFYLSNKALYHTRRTLLRKKIFIIPISELEFRIVPNVENMSFTLFVNEYKVLIFHHKEMKDYVSKLNAGDAYNMEQQYIQKCKKLNLLLNDFSSFS